MPEEAITVDDDTWRRLLEMLAWYESRPTERLRAPSMGLLLAATQYRWGKLDEDLLAGSTQTVSLWQTTGGGWEGWDEDSTVNQEGVYAPPTLPAGLLEATKWVLIGKINGRWVVLMYQC